MCIKTEVECTLDNIYFGFPTRPIFVYWKIKKEE